MSNKIILFLQIISMTCSTNY